MIPFNIIIFIFSSLVILTVAAGSIAICIMCIQKRRKRRLCPSEEAGRVQRGCNQLEEWPGMANILKQRQHEKGHQWDNGDSLEQVDEQANVQSIAGIIVVRPLMPGPVQSQIDITRRTTMDGNRNNLIHHEKSGSKILGQERHQQMEDYHEGGHGLGNDSTAALSSISTGETRSRDDTRSASILKREKEFKSTLWTNQGGSELKEEEEEVEEEETDTARKWGSKKILKNSELNEEEEAVSGRQDVEEGGKDEEGEEKEGKEEEDEQRETEAEKTERELLGTKSEDLPEDKAAEMEVKEAIQKAIGPPQPKID